MVDLLQLGTAGSSLTVRAGPDDAVTPPGEEPWFGVDVAVEAAPWSGVLETVFTRGELAAWADALAALDTGPGRATLGGGRAAEVVLEAERQVGGGPGLLAVRVGVVPSGDDPWPRIAFLVHGVDPDVWRHAVEAVRAL